MPEQNVDPILTSHVQELLQAERQQEQAAVNLASLLDKRFSLLRRIDSFDAQRHDVVQRRRHGEVEAGDGALLELIAADREGLQAILAEEAIELAAQQETLGRAQQMLAHRRDQLLRHERAVEQQALVAHAEHLGVLLLETMKRLRRDGGRDPWRPSDALYQEVRRVVAQHGGL